MSLPARKLDEHAPGVTRPHLARPTLRRLEPLRVVGPAERRHAGTHVEHAVRESLRAAMAPPVVEGLLEALEHEAGAPVPSSGEALDAFLEGPLNEALDRTLGPSATSFVMTELREVLHELLPRKSRVSEVRCRVAPADPSAGQARGPAIVTHALPVVIVVSRDAWLVGRLSRELDGAAVVRRVHDAWSLVEALDTPSSRAPLVLADCRKPELRELAASAHGATSGPLVLWGTDNHQALPLDARAASSAVTCSRVASPGDLAALCRVLLGIS